MYEAELFGEGLGQKRNRRWVVLDTMVETKVIEAAVRLACRPVLASAAWSRRLQMQQQQKAPLQ